VRTGEQPLQQESVLGEACERTGLSDFGAEDFVQPLQVLLHSLAEEARLTAAGHAGQRDRIVGLLVNRLRVQHWLTRHPEILEEPLDGPIVIVGFPRTGTTMLQRILASDPRATALLWWESRNPGPFPGWSPELAARKPDARIADAREQTRLMMERNPGLAAVHPFDPEAPDEESLLLEHAIRSTAPASFANVPSYLRWHLDHENRSAYRYLGQVLRFLQWQKRRRGEGLKRWVLKAPEHMSHLPLLLEQFPDATVVQPHRDPVEIYPSLASMIFELRQLASDDVDPQEAAHYVRTSSQHRIARLLEARRALPAEHFIDVWFGDLLSDPMAQVERIYERVGIELDEPARHAMAAWTLANRRDQRPTHSYTLEQFGFDAEVIRHELSEYRQTFLSPDGSAKR